VIWRAVFFLIVGCCAARDHTSDTSAATTRIGPTDVEFLDAGFTAAERDSIRGQIEQPTAINGAPSHSSMTITISVEMNLDGTVQSAVIQPSTDGDNPDGQSFAESCRRAIFRSSPLRMPLDKPYAAWKHIILTFNAKGMSDQ